MLQLIYISRASPTLTQKDLAELLAQSRKGNGEQGLSGMLLFKDGYFLQVLEGDVVPVRKLAERIAVDPRHSDLRILHETIIQVRDFPDWSMGFHQEPGSERLAGHSTFLDGTLTLESFTQAPPLAKALLLGFKGRRVRAAVATL